MGASGHADARRYVRSYLLVFAALLALTVLTVTAASLHLTVPLAIALALVIAVFKGSLVAGVFMHLVAERPLIYGALILTVVLLAAVMLLPLFTSLDQIGTAQAR